MCDRYRVLVKSENTPNADMFVRLRCKQWHCRSCARKNALIWRAFIIDTLNHKFSEREWSFVTITLPARIHKLPVEQRIKRSIELYRANWDRFMKRAKREFGNFEYVRVIEMHKSKVLHIHCIFSFHFSDIVKTRSGLQYSSWMKNNLKNCGFGFICNVQNLNGHAGLVAKYITKYMTKTNDAFHDAVRGLRVRRVQTSRGFGSPKEGEAEHTWEYTEKITRNDYLFALGRGKKLYDVNRAKEVTTEDFIDGEGRIGQVYQPIAREQEIAYDREWAKWFSENRGKVDKE